MDKNKEKQERTYYGFRQIHQLMLSGGINGIESPKSTSYPTSTEPGAAAGLLKLDGDRAGRRDKFNGIDI